jgi:outer membrane biosynthesis protein TonB
LQPENDIPTEAEVVKILAEEKIAGVVETKPEATSPAEPVLPLAAVVQPPQMKPAVPGEITVVQPRPAPKPTVRKAEAAKVQVSKPAMPQKAVVVQRASAGAPVQSLPIVVSPGPDEITLVRAPRSRVRIDIDRLPSQAREELEFFPTIIGRRQAATLQSVDVPDGVFSAYYDSTSGRSSIPYRSLAIGCGLIALMTLFLFGSRSFFESGDSVTAQATSQTETELPAAAPPQSAKALTPSKTTGEVRATKGAVAKETRDIADTKPTDREPAKVKKTEQRPVPERTAKAEPEKRRVERSEPAAAKLQPGTRPRIVKEPNP